MITGAFASGKKKGRKTAYQCSVCVGRTAWKVSRAFQADSFYMGNMPWGWIYQITVWWV